MRARLLVFVIFLNSALTFSQERKKEDGDFFTRPALVVGIMVDQMRYDYLTRFYHRYGEGGIKRLIDEGFSFHNAHFDYIPTATGPGHASVYTGAPPAVHGIIGNNWYDRFSGQRVYCAGDDEVTPVGPTGTKPRVGMMSPHRMKTTTITDELRLSTRFRSKVIGISIKDRGSILPAGHSANAAYWFHGEGQGKWVTSSHYMDELPDWVVAFNNSGAADKYMKPWNTLHPIDTYVESTPDNTPYEQGFKGKDRPTFPYDLAALAKDNGGYDIIRPTPFGNSLTTDFAIAAIEGEHLGGSSHTDFLAISYSSPDYLGHNFGVSAVETQDNYLRLDRDLERLFNYLDRHVGKGRYTVFLTSDHGVTEVPAYLQDRQIPAGYLDIRAFSDGVKTALREKYDRDDLIANMSNYQLFLNDTVITQAGLDQSEIEAYLAGHILKYPKIDRVYTRTQLEQVNYTGGMGARVQNGFHPKRSGDVVCIPDPSVISGYGNGGTTHGSGYNYDTQAPLLFMGAGIKKGRSYRRSSVTDIAPTLSALLGIARPNGATGRVLWELFE